MEKILLLLKQPIVLALLFIVNLIGTIYGYWWYKDQLAITPPWFLPFVPDSPTASLFFVLVLACFLIGKQYGLLEAFAFVTLVKYGIWAVVMNVAAGLLGAELNWQHYMLIFSHFGMALQAFLYSSYYRIKSWHLIVVAVWTIHNDIIDYVYLMHPWVSYSLQAYISHIGYFTFWLSLLSLFAACWLSCRKKRKTFDML